MNLWSSPHGQCREEDIAQASATQTLCLSSRLILNVEALCVGGAEEISKDRRTTPGDRCSRLRAVPVYALRFAFYSPSGDLLRS